MIMNGGIGTGGVEHNADKPGWEGVEILQCAPEKGGGPPGITNPRAGRLPRLGSAQTFLIGAPQQNPPFGDVLPHFPHLY